MPVKFKRCTRKLLAKGYGQKAYPICRVSTGYFGSTHDIGLLKPKSPSLKHQKMFWKDIRSMADHNLSMMAKGRTMSSKLARMQEMREMREASARYMRKRR